MLSDIFTILFYIDIGSIHIYIHLVLFKGRNILHYIDGHNFCNKSPVNGDLRFLPSTHQIFTDLMNNTWVKFMDKRVCTFQVF